MDQAANEPASPPVVRPPLKRKRHWLEENPPPPIRAQTIDQQETEHPGIKGKLRTWIHRADSGDPEFAWLKLCIIRVGRSIFIDDVRFRHSLREHTALPAAPSRRGGKVTA